LKCRSIIEYGPAPLFPGGTPFTSSPEIVSAVLQASKRRRTKREAMVEQPAVKLRRQA
jgi:cyclohexyl-isocyanide hydratase